MSDVVFDLLGDPIPDGWGKRGRPPHVPTDEKRLKVMVLLAFSDDEQDVADGLGISIPTLRKHYFRELKTKVSARKQLKASLLLSLAKEANAGNATAIDKLFKRIDKLELGEIEAAVRGRGEDRPRGPKAGKKEAAKEAAGEIEGVFAPPAGPRLN